MKIAIIGAGLGGLTFGALAAKDGHEVLIVEKNAKPGGVVALLEHEGYCFEQGPLLLGDLGKGEPVHALLQELNITLDTVRADRDIIMPDYEMVKPLEYQGPYWRKERLKELFPEDREGLEEYYRLYDNVMHLRYLSMQKPTLLNKLQLFLTFLKVRKYENMTVEALLSHLFKSEKIRTLYSGIFADFCADPNEVQGLGVVFTNPETAFDKRIPLEKNGKLYYPSFCFIQGGCQKLPEALAGYIADHGGKFLYETVADQVLIQEGSVRGIRLEDGTVIDADLVVGCGAGKDFFEKTVGLQHLDEEYRKILSEFKPMEAVFMLHLGVDYDPMQYLRSSLYYCYGMYDLHGATTKLRTGEYHEGDDGYLIFVPSYHAPEFAPEGKHCVTIYTVAPDRLKEGSWELRKEEYAQKLIHLAERQLPDLSKHITTMKIMTAEDYRRYTHMEKSSFGGVVPIWNQKNPPHVTPVKGLYFVGQQSENAGGVGAVMMGAKSAYEKAMKQ
ncbi:MAG: NAD(P)/FAD-dependent oxidoreductase [Oscillospiraceae bacterium]|nr:NAD(P)/FAD-dependent oxidoreductase [Oscillospiraceae bacterium]